MDFLTLSYYENHGWEFNRSKNIALENKDNNGGLDAKALETVRSWWEMMRKPILVGEYGKYQVGWNNVLHPV